MRGENCPMASWTATSVTVRTVVVSGMTDDAIVVRMSCASDTVPTRLLGSSARSWCRSSTVVRNERPIPAPTPTSGISHTWRRSASATRNHVIRTNTYTPGCLRVA